MQCVWWRTGSAFEGVLYAVCGARMARAAPKITVCLPPRRLLTELQPFKGH